MERTSQGLIATWYQWPRTVYSWFGICTWLRRTLTSFRKLTLTSFGNPSSSWECWGLMDQVSSVCPTALSHLTKLPLPSGRRPMRASYFRLTGASERRMRRRLKMSELWGTTSALIGLVWDSRWVLSSRTSFSHFTTSTSWFGRTTSTLLFSNQRTVQNSPITSPVDAGVPRVPGLFSWGRPPDKSTFGIS